MARRESTRVAMQKSLGKSISSSTSVIPSNYSEDNLHDAAVEFSSIERKIFEGSGVSPATRATKIRTARPTSLIVERVNYDKKLSNTTETKSIKENSCSSFNKKYSSKTSIPTGESTTETKILSINASRNSTHVVDNIMRRTKVANGDGIKKYSNRPSSGTRNVDTQNISVNKPDSIIVDAKSAKSSYVAHHSNTSFEKTQVSQLYSSKSISKLPETKNPEMKSTNSKKHASADKPNYKHKVPSNCRKPNPDCHTSGSSIEETDRKKSKQISQSRKSSRPSIPVRDVNCKGKSNSSQENLHSIQSTNISKKSVPQKNIIKSSDSSSKRSSNPSCQLSGKAKSYKDSSNATAIPKRVKKSSSGAHLHSQSSESELSDWEDVEGNAINTTWNNLDSLLQKDEAAALDLLTKKIGGKGGTEQHQQPSTSGVQIELEAPTLWGMNRRMKSKKSDEYWMMVYLRREVNQTIRDDYINCHKVHLLLLLGHGQHVNRLLNSEELLASALSIVSNKDVYPPKRIDLGYLEKFARWFTKKISRVEEPLEKGYWFVPLTKTLAKRFEKKESRTTREAVFMFVLIGRALGMNVRLVWSLKPLHWKPSTEELFRPPLETDGRVTEPKKPGTKSAEVNRDVRANGAENEKKRNKIVSSSSDESRNSKSCSKSKSKVVNSKVTGVSDNKRKKVVKSESSYSDDDSDFEITVSQKKKKIIKKNQASNSGKSNQSANSKTSTSSSNSCKRSLSIDSSKESEKKKKKVDTFPEWAEVYVEEEERWICVDVIRGKIHCAAELASRASTPVAYVTAFNPDQSVKDVTKRYVSSWLAYESKLRCDSSWWGRVLVPYAPPFSSRERAEDLHMDESLKQQPLPKTIAEYKNHPMYALQRHLLKFEALYPPNPDPVGYFKGEAVFPRECVHTLHSRDIWLKQAKTVRVDEEPYKIVKARPKWDRVLCQMITDRPLDVFGSWQVEDYKPPVAKDGRVPRNEYGNVELFKPTMLPVGTVHLGAEYEDISRVARKLKIDCASAMVGFDFHKGGTHPVFDGYVVCTEFKEILVDAWREEMELKAKREEAKRVRRIYDNWKRLIQGMIVKHHVREQYGTGRDSSDESDQEGAADTDCKRVKGAAKTKKEPSATEAQKTKQQKRKIKQKDIDAARPENSKKEKVQLGIDFRSDTVTMAKNIFKQSLSSKGMVTNEKIDGVDTGLHSIVPKEEDLILDSDEEIKETDEEKKLHLQKILAWGNNSTGDALEGLSDNSDAEGEEKEKIGVIKSGSSDDEQMETTGNAETAKGKKKVTATSKHRFNKNKQGSEDSSSDFESTDDHQSKTHKATIRKKMTKKKQPPALKTKMSKVKSGEGAADETCQSRRTRRSSRRSTARSSLTVVYKESEESDISLDESDMEDKSYKPVELQGSLAKATTPFSGGCDDLNLSEDSC